MRMNICLLFSKGQAGENEETVQKLRSISDLDYF